MTRFEQIASAFPLHAQRIAELAGERWLERARIGSISPWLSPADQLRGAFHWVATSEGDAYWRALYEGARS